MPGVSTLHGSYQDLSYLELCLTAQDAALRWGKANTTTQPDGSAMLCVRSHFKSLLNTAGAAVSHAGGAPASIRISFHAFPSGITVSFLQQQ